MGRVTVRIDILFKDFSRVIDVSEVLFWAVIVGKFVMYFLRSSGTARKRDSLTLTLRIF